jgi:hypothetical protein
MPRAGGHGSAVMAQRPMMDCPAINPSNAAMASRPSLELLQ